MSHSLPCRVDNDRLSRYGLNLRILELNILSAVINVYGNT